MKDVNRVGAPGSDSEILSTGLRGLSTIFWAKHVGIGKIVGFFEAFPSRPEDVEATFVAIDASYSSLTRHTWTLPYLSKSEIGLIPLFSSKVPFVRQFDMYSGLPRVVSFVSDNLTGCDLRRIWEQ
jgi:hypothetical protein